jgi:hypothetical protein
MIPRYDIEIAPQIPANATFWTPTEEELEENGAPGDFHDTERIETDRDEAESVLEAERVAIDYVDAHSATASEFDELSDEIEFEVPDWPTEDAPSFITEGDWYGVNGLELGVAGLVYALNAVGVVTAASCRSHAAPHRRWSEHPVVIVAANESQSQLLQPLVASAGCGFEIDGMNRPHLLGICGPSIVEMMVLGRAVLDQFRTTDAD